MTLRNPTGLPTSEEMRNEPEASYRRFDAELVRGNVDAVAPFLAFLDSHSFDRKWRHRGASARQTIAVNGLTNDAYSVKLLAEAEAAWAELGDETFRRRAEIQRTLLTEHDGVAGRVFRLFNPRPAEWDNLANELKVGRGSFKTYERLAARAHTRRQATLWWATKAARSPRLSPHLRAVLLTQALEPALPRDYQRAGEALHVLAALGVDNASVRPVLVQKSVEMARSALAQGAIDVAIDRYDDAARYAPELYAKALRLAIDRHTVDAGTSLSATMSRLAEMSADALRNELGAGRQPHPSLRIGAALHYAELLSAGRAREAQDLKDLQKQIAVTPVGDVGNEIISPALDVLTRSHRSHLSERLESLGVTEQHLPELFDYLHDLRSVAHATPAVPMRAGERKRLDESMDWFVDRLWESGHPETFYFDARRDLDRGDIDAAITKWSLQRGIEWKSNWSAEIAISLTKHGRGDVTERWFKDDRTINGDLRGALLAQALASRGRIIEAIDAVKGELQSTPDLLASGTWLALALSTHGDLEGAGDVLERLTQTHGPDKSFVDAAGRRTTLADVRRVITEAPSSRRFPSEQELNAAHAVESEDMNAELHGEAFSRDLVELAHAKLVLGKVDEGIHRYERRSRDATNPQERAAVHSQAYNALIQLGMPYRCAELARERTHGFEQPVRIAAYEYLALAAANMGDHHTARSAGRTAVFLGATPTQAYFASLIALNERSELELVLNEHLPSRPDVFRTLTLTTARFERNPELDAFMKGLHERGIVTFEAAASLFSDINDWRSSQKYQRFLEQAELAINEGRPHYGPVHTAALLSRHVDTHLGLDRLDVAVDGVRRAIEVLGHDTTPDERRTARLNTALHETVSRLQELPDQTGTRAAYELVKYAADTFGDPAMRSHADELRRSLSPEPGRGGPGGPPRRPEPPRRGRSHLAKRDDRGEDGPSNRPGLER